MAGAAGAARAHRQRAALVLFAWQSLQQQRGGQTHGVTRKASQWLKKEATGPTAAVAFRVREQKHRKHGRSNAIK